MAENDAPTSPSEQKPKHWLTRGVLGIGLASLFSDWGHEAATSILPAFLASLGAPAVALGIIEGVSDGLSSFAKLAGGWIADRPSTPQADRHHRLSRHRRLNVRIRFRAHLARSFGVASAWMGGPRQSRAVARHSARRQRRSGSRRPRIRLRARDGHSRRRPRTALRYSAFRCIGRSRRSDVGRASGPRRGSCVCLSRARRQPRGRAPCPELRFKLQSAAKILLAFSCGSIRARHRRFCSHAFNSPRQPDSRPSFRNRTSCDDRCSPLHFLQFHQRFGVLSSRRAR